jgi:hypothetical protein
LAIYEEKRLIFQKTEEYNSTLGSIMKLVRGHLMKSNLMSRLLHQASYRLSQAGGNNLSEASLDVELTQRTVLKKILSSIEGSQSAHQQNIEKHTSLQEFQQRVPITDYHYWQALIQEQQEDNKPILTKHECQRYQPTSGSTSKIKWIPYTQEFLNELDNAISPWIGDMYEKYPGILKGKHYWSLSWVPSDLRNKLTTSINNDLQLLPWWKRLFMAGTMAVPESISLAETSDESFFATAAYLLSCSDLSFISVWSPTFALSLLEFMQTHKVDLQYTLNKGKWPQHLTGLNNINCPKNPRSARILAKWNGKIDADFTQSIWPNLALISAWDTSSSKIWAAKLHALFPHCEFQGKGLWATEGVVSIPFQDKYPLAINSHFYEFEDLSDGKIYTSWQLKEGQNVRPIISSSNGLLRYAMKDQLKVTSFINQCPCFEFIGRIDGTDLVGEKISPEVAIQLINHFNQVDTVTPITLIALPAKKAHEKPRYALLCSDLPSLIEGDTEQTENSLSKRLEEQLCEHFHYKLARELGQLDSARVMIKKDALNFYAQHKIDQGMVKGNIKVEPLITWENNNFSFETNSSINSKLAAVS